MRRRIEAGSVTGSPQEALRVKGGGNGADLMPGPTFPVDSFDEFQRRMAEQRRTWRQQDLRRYRDPERESLDVPLLWCIYQWRPRSKRWEYVGQRRIQSKRRKPMTMNRLFAAIRYKFGINRMTVIKLITLEDDILRKGRGTDLAPPVHRGGRVVPGMTSVTSRGLGQL